jgi:hypothetical protein
MLKPTEERRSAVEPEKTVSINIGAGLDKNACGEGGKRMPPSPQALDG